MSATGSHFVTITEVGTRDGFQAEKEQISVADKVAVIDALIDAGLRSVEATSFVSPRALPQLADAADVMAQVQRKPGVKLFCDRQVACAHRQR
jgi:hydroxymethylglutaryl-CoA lyase